MSKPAKIPPFSGTVSCGKCSLSIHYLHHASNNRVVVSVPIDVNPYTYHNLCTAEGGASYGTPDMAAFVKSVGQSVEERLNHDLRGEARCNIVAHCANVGGGSFNISVTCGKSVSNARVTAGFIMAGLKPVKTAYEDNIRKLTDSDGKIMRPDADAYLVCCATFARALDKTTILIVGGGKVKDKKDATEMCEKICKKMPETPSGKTGSLPARGNAKLEHPDKYEVIKFKDAFHGIVQYHYYTSGQSRGRLYGNELVLERGKKGSLEKDDVKKSWSAQIAKSWAVPGVGLAYAGASCGHFAADDLIKLCNDNVTASSIKAAL